MATLPGPWTPVNGFRPLLWTGAYDLSATSTYKIALVTSSSNISTSSTTWAGVTGELANANGYTTGGIAVTMTVAGTSTVTIPTTTNQVWNATPSSLTARYAVLYKVGGNVLAFLALDRDPTTLAPIDLVAAVGQNITIDSDGTPSPIFTHN